MALDERRFLYKKKTVNGNEELDYIQTKLTRMNISFIERFTITQSFEFRADLISFRFYKTFDLGWLICDYNDIIDPFEQLTTGTEIKIPNLEEYYSFFNRNSSVR